MKCDTGGAGKRRDRIFIQSSARSEISEIQAPAWAMVVMLNRLEYQPASEQITVNLCPSIMSYILENRFYYLKN